MAGPLALTLALGLGILSFAMRGVGPFLTTIPTAVQERTAGLAPALLAALVAVELTGSNGRIHLDAQLPAVVVAAGLAAMRAPLIVSVVSGAIVAALLRAIVHT